MAGLYQLIAARDALNLARGQSIREVRDSDGTAVSYKSDSEMAAALAALNSQIAQLSRGSVRQVIFTTSKGL